MSISKPCVGPKAPKACSHSGSSEWPGFPKGNLGKSSTSVYRRKINCNHLVILYDHLFKVVMTFGLPARPMMTRGHGCT